MTSFALLLALRTPEVTVDQATAAGTRILAAFGVPGPYRRIGATVANNPKEPDYDIGVVTRGEVAYYLRVDKVTGRCWLVEREGVPLGGEVPARPKNALSPEAQRRTAARGVARLKPPYPTLSPVSMETGRSDLVWVSVALQGYSFVDTRDYDYEVRLNALTGVLEEFCQPHLPPDVGAAKPRLSERDAVAIAERLLVKPGYAFDVRLDRSNRPKSTDADRRLGWYVPKGPRAHDSHGRFDTSGKRTPTGRAATSEATGGSSSMRRRGSGSTARLYPRSPIPTSDRTDERITFASAPFQMRSLETEHLGGKGILKGPC